MSATLSPAERARFLQALKEDSDFREAVRQHLLSDALLELPEKFAQFAAYVNEFIANTNEFIANTNKFIADQKAFNTRTEERLDRIDDRLDRVEGRLDRVEGRLDRVEGRLDRVEGRLDRIDNHLDRIDNRLDRIDDSIGILKGNAARRLLRDHLEGVLELVGVEDFVRILSSSDLIRLMRTSGMAREIPYGERRSFYAADLVIEAADATGAPCYITAEGSFTADKRDSSRAIRNAAFLTRLTGHPASPVVASMRNDYEVQELVNQETIRWFQLDERDLEAD